MKETFQKFLATPIGSACRIAVAAVLGYLVLDLSQDGSVSVSWDELNTWVAAAIVVGLPVVIAAINPADPRFGRGSGE
jgi:hypothetical protein